jgi:UDP-N-acetylmuramoylalanine--D-glutamate ligase
MPIVAPDFIAPRLKRRVAIFGGGVSGDGVATLVMALGGTAIIYDAKGFEFTAATARDHDLVVYSPGFQPDHPWLQLAREAGAECLGELDFASLFWRGEIVAVTGTNGKTTTTELLTHAYRAVGRTADATGNIGYSFSRLVADRVGGLANDIAVCEVSSFQAETLRHLRARWVLWTNFAEDHLERHPSLEAYFAAKWNLIAHTMTTPSGGGAFIGSSVRRFAVKFDRPLNGVTSVETENQPADPELAGTPFAEYPQRENFLLVKAMWHAAGLSQQALHAAARTFKLGDHRLSRIAEIKGVTYWNDSKATNFHAVEAALASFRAPVVLIVGGKPKGGDIAGFIQRLRGRVWHVVLIGATRLELAMHCKAFGIAHSPCDSLNAAVARAAELAPPGGHVLLSPGFASFDQFRSYEDRGAQFEKVVRELAASAADNHRVSTPV